MKVTGLALCLLRRVVEARLERVEEMKADFGG